MEAERVRQRQLERERNREGDRGGGGERVHEREKESKREQERESQRERERERARTPSCSQHSVQPPTQHCTATPVHTDEPLGASKVYCTWKSVYTVAPPSAHLAWSSRFAVGSTAMLATCFRFGI